MTLLASITDPIVEVAVSVVAELGLVGLALWIVGHGAAVWLAKRDPAFVEVAVRHTKHKGWLTC